MTGPRVGLRAAAVAVVLAVPVLAGCEAAQQAQEVGQGVDKAADCAALVGELTGINWSDVQQAPAEAEQAAQNLDQRLREVDDADVKQAGEALRDRVRALADALPGSKQPSTEIDRVASGDWPAEVKGQGTLDNQNARPAGTPYG